MSSLPQDVDAGPIVGGGPPAPWWSAASPVGGDVVLSGAVLLFLAVAFAFVVYHYFTVGLGRRRRCAARVVGVPSASGAAHQRRGTTSSRVGGVDTAALPVTVYRSAKDGRAGGEALECAVCLAELADGEAARFLPRCGHGFHAECVDLWLRRHPTCPLCRVEVDKTGPAPWSLALPPALPEPANYPTSLPTNVMFWGSQDTVAIVGGGSARTSRGASAAAAALVIEIRESALASVAPRTPERGGDEGKAQGLASLRSLGRLRSRGRHEVAAAASSRSCRHATAGAADGTERAPAAPVDIWNLT